MMIGDNHISEEELQEIENIKSKDFILRSYGALLSKALLALLKYSAENSEK